MKMSSSAFDLNEIIEHVAHWVPAQGPIHEFIHHNTLHAFQEKPFHEGIREAATLFGARAYMPASFYAQAAESGRINEAGSMQALRVLYSSESKRAEAAAILRSPRLLGHVDPRPASIGQRGLRAGWRERFGAEMDGFTRPLLFRLIAGFLDQGVSDTAMPFRERPFYEAVNQLLRESFVGLPPLDDLRCRELLLMPPQKAVEEALREIVGDPSMYSRYLAETLLSHPGWSGMVRQVELNPGSLLQQRRVSLMEFVAVELILEVGWARRMLGKSDTAYLAARLPGVRHEASVPLANAGEWDALALWHEAYEWSYYDSFFKALREKKGASTRAVTGVPVVQALFCIDDRECSLRRHLEETLNGVETLGAAGFFNVDCYFQRAGEWPVVKQAPLPAKPKHLLKEKPRAQQTRHLLRKSSAAHAGSDRLGTGWLAAMALGPLHGAGLLWESLRPHGVDPAVAAGRATAEDFELVIGAEPSAATVAGAIGNGALIEGFTIEEMATRVGGLLRSIGATRDFAPLFVVFGHGHSSTNNLYFAAYDCGACSGRSGAPNARALAAMANRPDVRGLLKERGIEIPSSTWFVGSVHDTTRDLVTFYDEAAIPDSHRQRFAEFRVALEQSLALNAQERCRRFATVKTGIDPQAALREVRSRAGAIGEPRPELNHANNAACIVGRRSLSRGSFLDRRSFLNSYDPKSDPEGTILQGILGAVVPVCGGINLEYFFSRLDPDRYGAGTKLSQNVVGLIGVQNGPEGDLLTGLPLQMTELHEPVRLLMLIEQTPEITLKAARANPAVWEWVANGWIRFFCIDPEDSPNEGGHRIIRWFDGKEFVKC